MEYINILIVGTATKLRGTCKKKAQNVKRGYRHSANTKGGE